ncbi:MAG: pentapeptide repeat-containing protein [Pontiellaceae bacterium]
MQKIKWFRYGLLSVVYLIMTGQSIASGKYITRHLTDNNETEDYTTIGISGTYVCWQGENKDVYVNTGVGGTVEIPTPSGGVFNRAFDTTISGDYVAFRARETSGSSYCTYLYNVTSGITTNLSGTSANYPVISEDNVYWVGWDGSKYQIYKYNILSDSTAQISTSGSDHYIVNLDVSGDSAAWMESDSSTSEYDLCIFDGASTHTVTNLEFISNISVHEDQVVFMGQKLYDGTIPSLIGEIVSDGSKLWFYDASTESLTNIEVANLFSFTEEVTLSDIDLLGSGITFQADVSYGGDYQGISGMPSSDNRIYFISIESGVTNTIPVSQYRYDGGVVNLVTDESIPTEEGIPPYSGTLPLPTRDVRHDISPVMGDGVIGYHAYNVYEYNTDNDELMIYDIADEKHYALFVDDPDIAPTKRSDHWAHVSGRNVAWFSQYVWGYGTPYSDEIAVGYWVGQGANLKNVDLSNEDLSDLDLSDADLTGADLSGADLTGTDFSGATLSGTIFSNAIYDTTTVMPMSFVPGDYEMISFSVPSPLSVELTGISMEGVSYSNSMSNIYVGVEYTQSLTAEWHDAEVQGVILFATNAVGSIPIPIGSIEMPQLFLRLIGATNSIWDSTAYTNPVVQFVQSDYIDLDKIEWISKFRSGMGHDYSDDFESCSSMKHYYQPSVSNWTDVGIYAPVDGTILSIENNEEFGDVTVMIKSDDHPAYKFILFHLQLEPSITNGASVVAGQAIGYHGSNDTISDIAVRISTEDDGILQHRLVSYFDVMTDGLFSNYVARGVSDRSEMIISYEDRTNDMLICSGETFVTNNVIAPGGGYGNITNKVELSTP